MGSNAGSPVASFEFQLPGAPRGKNRPRFAKGRTFTDAATVEAEGDLVGRWIAVGSPRLEGPVGLRVELEVERPRGHFRRDGSLSAEGQRHPWPERAKPDLDNALKLVMDALNSRAWADDVQIVYAAVCRGWAPTATTHVWAWACAPLTPQEAA